MLPGKKMEGDIGAGGRIILKWILQKQGMHMSA
jgi:hypothetical protein